MEKATKRWREKESKKLCCVGERTITYWLEQKSHGCKTIENLQPFHARQLIHLPGKIFHFISSGSTGKQFSLGVLNHSRRNAFNEVCSYFVPKSFYSLSPTKYKIRMIHFLVTGFFVWTYSFFILFLSKSLYNLFCTTAPIKLQNIWSE